MSFKIMIRSDSKKNRGKVCQSYQRTVLLQILQSLTGNQYDSSPMYREDQSSIDSLCLEIEMILRLKGLIISR
mgnify:FL=1